MTDVVTVFQSAPRTFVRGDPPSRALPRPGPRFNPRPATAKAESIELRPIRLHFLKLARRKIGPSPVAVSWRLDRFYRVRPRRVRVSSPEPIILGYVFWLLFPSSINECSSREFHLNVLM